MNALSGSFGRLELKYLIGERTAARIRRQIAPYCRNDEHSFESPTRRGFLRAFVPLTLMVLWWSWGEWLGYVTGSYPSSLVVAPEIRAAQRELSRSE